MATTRVGFIGLGIMGRSMARNILGRGFPLLVYNRTAGRTADLAALGATVAKSPRAVAEQADVTCMCVTGPADVLALVTGPDGVAAGARPGSLFVDLSTIGPAMARQVAELLAAHGVAALDAPVTGGDTGAAAGTLTIMVGGDEAAFARARPVLEAMGTHIFHLGPAGAGQAAKVVANLIGGINLAAAAEGLALGRRFGLDPAGFLAVLEESSARSASLSLLGQRLATGNDRPGFSVANRHKDLALAMDMAEQVGLPLPVSALVTQLFAAVRGQGLADRDQTVYHRLLEHWITAPDNGQPRPA